MTFVNEKPGTKPSDGWRTVDYERDAILQSHGGTDHAGQGRQFTLQWQNISVSFKANLTTEIGANPDKMDHKWEIIKFTIPAEFETKRQEIYRLIHEALTEWGFLYDNSFPNRVEVDFSRINHTSRNVN